MAYSCTLCHKDHSDGSNCSVLGPPSKDAIMKALDSVSADPPLTKEQAMADVMRALKECYPDRWERVWQALGKESASDKAVASAAKAAAENPTAAMGAIIGGFLGAALGKSTDKSRR